MPNYDCPTCQALLSPADMNVAEGVALCRGCGALARLSDLVEQPDPGDLSLSHPPAGCDMRQEIDGVTVRVSHRSLAAAAGLLFFGGFWNSIVSVFVLLALSGLYINLIGPLPAWFPGPASTGGSNPMSLGMTLFLCVFITPFVAIGLFLIGAFFMALAGRTVIRIAGADSSVSTGIGPLRWTRRFDAFTVERVVISGSSDSKGNRRHVIEMQTAEKPIRVGSGLSKGKLDWLCAALRSLLPPDQRRL